MSHAGETGIIETENNTYVVNKKDIIELRI